MSSSHPECHLTGLRAPLRTDGGTHAVTQSRCRPGFSAVKSLFFLLSSMDVTGGALTLCTHPVSPSAFTRFSLVPRWGGSCPCRCHCAVLLGNQLDFQGHVGGRPSLGRGFEDTCQMVVEGASAGCSSGLLLGDAGQLQALGEGSSASPLKRVQTKNNSEVMTSGEAVTQTTSLIHSPGLWCVTSRDRKGFWDFLF